MTEGPAEATGSDMVDAMERVGVGRAVLVSYFGPYGFDVSYALRVADEFPDRFRVVAPVDPERDDLDAAVAALAEEPRIAGLRLLMISTDAARHGAEGRFDALFRAARRHDMPVSVMTWHTEALPRLAARYPGNLMAVDHLGLEQPRHPSDPRRGFSDLPHLLSAARFDNVCVKVSGVPTLSRVAYPFDDVWPHLDQVLGAFGVDRTMWGSDWTRVADFATYRESLDYVRETPRLGASDKEAILSATARRVYGWKAP